MRDRATLCGLEHTDGEKFVLGAKDGDRAMLQRLCGAAASPRAVTEGKQKLKVSTREYASPMKGGKRYGI